MKTKIKNSQAAFLLPVLAFFLIGLWFVVLQPMGPGLSKIPGDLIDSRFNYYILEHDFRWLSGTDPSLWNVPFFYPNTKTLAFSDNHLGTMLFYSVFRCLGADRETAFQAWYILGFILNFISAVYVLKRLDLKPLAISTGAFLFTFGLPVVAQDGHAQLLYRFCIPLVCYYLWAFSQKPSFIYLVIAFFGITWQYYTSIYLGNFLALFLLVVILLMPFLQKTSARLTLSYWPNMVRKAWKDSRLLEKISCLVITLGLVSLLRYLFINYSDAIEFYGFTRYWEQIESFLPRVQSYFLSDRSLIWRPLLTWLQLQIPYSNNEQQLFVGGAAMIFIGIGLIHRFSSPHKRMASLYLIAAGLLIILTLDIAGFSLYKLIRIIPGFDGMRAISRIILLILWPVAVFISITIDAILRGSNREKLLRLTTIFLVCFLVSESIFTSHTTYAKADAQLRIERLQAKIPLSVPDDPILFMSYHNPGTWNVSEMDSMLLAQNLGWPAMNGYSGFEPRGYGSTLSCDQSEIRIMSYMDLMGISDPTFYINTFQRIIFINSGYCGEDWLNKEHSFSVYSGPFPQELFAGIVLTIKSVIRAGDHLIIQTEIENNSSLNLPALSKTNNPVRLSWRMVDVTNQIPASGFTTRWILPFDIPPGTHTVITIVTDPPDTFGRYYVEMTAVQESVAWFHDRGMQTAISTQIISVDDNHRLHIENPR